MQLDIGLVPQPLWRISALVCSRPTWQVIRQNALRAAEYRCHTCGNTESPLVCDEQWHYDDKHAIAELVGFEAHCLGCYLGHHIGLAVDSDLGDIAFAQLCQVNRISKAQAQELYNDAVRVWRKRSKWKADVDAALLGRYPQLQAVIEYKPQ